MASAKSLRVSPIASKHARTFVKEHHYSGKVVANSQLHFGVFWEGRLAGVMQFGPSMDKRKMLGLVEGTEWHDFLEINRMAFDDTLPKNSESRALAVAFKLIRKNYPQIKWVVSFADATQCGDGTIYRAAGFVLTGIHKNTTIVRLPTGDVVANKTLAHNSGKDGRDAGWWRRNGAAPLVGFQLRYIYFLDRASRAKLTVDEIPFSKIAEMGAGMYKGKPRVKQAMADSNQHSGGAAPTHTLQGSP